MNYEEMKKQYEKTFEIYSDDRFEEIISIKDLDKIVRCYENFEYCHQNGLKFNTRSRCKKRYCPICNYYFKARKYFEVIEKIEKISDKYLMFSLTLNGRNVEIDCEKVQKEMKENNEKFGKLIKKYFFKNIVKGYLKVVELVYIPERNNFLPHLHIILFTIRGAYKKFKMNEIRDKISVEWEKLKGEKLNTQFKRIGESKIKKTISYFTTSKKKRLINFFYLDKEVLMVYLKSMRNKKLYSWSRSKNMS